MGNNIPEDSRKEIEEAFEVVPDEIAKWNLGLETGKKYFERNMKLRNDVN